MIMEKINEAITYGVRRTTQVIKLNLPPTTFGNSIAVQDYVAVKATTALFKHFFIKSGGGFNSERQLIFASAL